MLYILITSRAHTRTHARARTRAQHPGVSTTPITSSKLDVIPGILWYDTKAPNGLVELGVFFVGIAAQIPLWTVAYGLTRLPLVRDVL